MPPAYKRVPTRDPRIPDVFRRDVGFWFTSVIRPFTFACCPRRGSPVRRESPSAWRGSREVDGSPCERGRRSFASTTKRSVSGAHACGGRRVRERRGEALAQEARGDMVSGHGNDGGWPLGEGGSVQHVLGGDVRTGEVRVPGAGRGQGRRALRRRSRSLPPLRLVRLPVGPPHAGGPSAEGARAGAARDGGRAVHGRRGVGVLVRGSRSSGRVTCADLPPRRPTLHRSRDGAGPLDTREAPS